MVLVFRYLEHLQFPSALPGVLPACMGTTASAELGQVWKFLFYQGAPRASLTLPGTFQILSKISSEPLML